MSLKLYYHPLSSFCHKALFYANCILPIDHTMKYLTAYFGRLMARPSCLRTLGQAEPYFHLFPMEPKPRLPITPMEKT